jgi:putative copper export protein
VSPELVAFALGVNRVLTDAGYVLLAGTFIFWSLVWPDGRASRRLVVLSVVGTALLVLGTLTRAGVPVVLGGQLLGDALSPLLGAALLVRLAAVSATTFFLVDLIRQPIVRGRRIFALSVVVVIAATLVVQSDAVDGRWAALTIITSSGHLLATAAWLGGLVALAVVLIPGESPPALEGVRGRFGILANVSVIVLIASGLVQAAVAAGGIGPLVGSRYGLVLLIKVLFVGLMLVVGGFARRYAGRELFRERYHPSATLRGGSRRRRLVVVMGAELTIALVILSVSSLLVAVAPH